MHKPERLLFAKENDPSLPTIIYFCCVHGNEKASYHALNQTFKQLEKSEIQLKGNVYVILGNREAFVQEVRFIDKDLNRIWTKSHMASALDGKLASEYNELLELYETLYYILNRSTSEIIAIDLHTTSAPTKPFIIMNDALNNRDFVRQLGYPVIFNVETYIVGTLLNLMNDLGHTSIAFEGGEHYAEEAVEEIKKFCFKTLFHAELISRSDVEKLSLPKDYIQLKSSSYYEMVFRQNLEPNDQFQMKSGFSNFQALKKGEEVATLNNMRITAPKSARIFMPLYQAKGEDGFFFIKEISSIKLKVARYLRNLEAERVLCLLPGIKKLNHYTIGVPKSIDKFIPQRFLFALGYRKSVETSGKFLYTKQERKLTQLPKIKQFKSPYIDMEYEN